MNAGTLSSFGVLVMGCIIIMIILIQHKDVTSRMLAFFLFSLTYSTFIMFLVESRFILALPHFFRTGTLVAYLIAPSFFLFVTFSLNRRKRISWKHSIHLLPALIYCIDYFPFLSSEVSYKRKILNNLLLDHPGALLAYREGWLLPPGFHYTTRILVALGYIFLAAILLFRYYKHGFTSVNKKEIVFPWLMTITVIYGLFEAVCLYTGLFSTQQTMWNFHLINILLIIFCISMLLFFKPQILYNIQVNTLSTESKKEVKPKQFILPEDTAIQLQQLLQNYINKQSYLKKNITLNDVAAELRTRPYILSAHISHTYNLHFNDLINKSRIEYIRDGLMDKKWQSLTLEAIAGKAGFSNRTTFLTAFKKFTGMTPTIFIRDHLKKNGNYDQGDAKEKA